MDGVDRVLDNEVAVVDNRYLQEDILFVIFGQVSQRFELGDLMIAGQRPVEMPLQPFLVDLSSDHRSRSFLLACFDKSHLLVSSACPGMIHRLIL